MRKAGAKKRILCIPYTHTISHISRPLMVAKELRKRGHELIFAGESSKIKFIQQEGFKVYPLYELDPEMLYGNIRKGKLKFVSDKELERMLEADVELYNKTSPDIVLTDGRFTAPISTYIAKLKHAAIVNVSSTEFRALPYIPFFDWIPEQLMRRNTQLWDMLDLLNLKLEMFIFDNAGAALKKMSRKYGIKKNVTATNCLTGKDITLLSDVPEYFPVRSLPDNYHYIGPLTLKSNISPPPWWPPDNNRYPLIYITMGSTGIGDFFHKAYEFFSALNMTAVITTGAQVEAMENLDGKIYVEPFIDGDLVMEKSSLVVCHGGNGTIYQALLHGTPIIGIPTIPDQSFNMRRVAALKVGRSLDWNDFCKNPEILIDTICDVLGNPVYAKKARQMQSLLKQYNGAMIGANLIEKHFINQKDNK